MKRFVSLKSLAISVLVLGTLAANTTAHAQSDVQFSITLGTPGVYVQPTPVYAYPRPVYEQSASMYGGASNATIFTAVTRTPKALGETTITTARPTAMTAFQGIRIVGDCSGLGEAADSPPNEISFQVR